MATLTIQQRKAKPANITPIEARPKQPLPAAFHDDSLPNKASLN